MGADSRKEESEYALTSTGLLMEGVRKKNGSLELRSSWGESTDHPVPERSVAHGDRQEGRHHHPGVTDQIPPIRRSAHCPLKNKKQAPEEQHRSPDIQGRKRRKVFYVGKPAQCAGLDYDCAQ